MSTRVQNHVVGRLSLRPPQSESLQRLVRAIDGAPELLRHERNVGAVLSSLKAHFTTLEEFEREFPSWCFSLATGVGKTRLMGAFIAYRPFSRKCPCSRHFQSEIYQFRKTALITH